MTVPRPSTIPATVTAILAAFVAAVDADTEVQDGPKPKAIKRKAIAVGVGPESILHTLAKDQRLGGFNYNEQYQVVCSLWSWSGSVATMPTHRANCGALLNVVRTAVDALNVADTLGVLYRLGPDLSWLQTYTGEGCACSVGFSIEVTATI